MRIDNGWKELTYAVYPEEREYANKAKNEYNRRQRLESRETLKEFKRLMREKFEPLYYGKGWCVRLELNRLVATSTNDTMINKNVFISVLGESIEKIYGFKQLNTVVKKQVLVGVLPV